MSIKSVAASVSLVVSLFMVGCVEVSDPTDDQPGDELGTIEQDATVNSNPTWFAVPTEHRFGEWDVWVSRYVHLAMNSRFTVDTLDESSYLAIAGSVFWRCTPSGSLQSYDFGTTETYTVVGVHRFVTMFSLGCANPSETFQYLQVRLAPRGAAVGFYDGEQSTGDGTNFFPDNQVLINSGSLVARTTPIRTEPLKPSIGPGDGRVLVVRYIAPYGTGNAQVKIMNYDTASTILTFPTTAFPGTSGEGMDKWNTVRFRFNTTSSWPSQIYARVEWKSSHSIFMDAVWQDQIQ